YASFFILSALILFGLAYALVSSLLRERDEESIRAEVNELAAQYRVVGLDAIRATLELQERAGMAEPFLLRVLRSDGTTLFDKSKEQWAKYDAAPLQAAAAASDDRLVRLERRSGRGHALEGGSPRPPHGAILEVGKTTRERERVVGRYRGTAERALLPVAVFGVIGGACLASWALRPIREIIDTVRAIQAGSLDARVPTRHARDELHELAVLFNGMLDRIATLIPLMRGALDNVTHDLRTPITRIRGAAEMALRSPDDRDGCLEALADCVDEADHVLTMLNTLMDISEAETGSLALRLNAVDLRSVLEDVVDLYRHVSEEAGVALSTAAQLDVWVTMDRNRMRQVFANLLDNAIKYTPPGGRVELRREPRPDAVVVTG